ncbi:carboxymuconolactone decarboxylase family protein [Agrobacterium rubi]|uniref:Peroxidase n=1 Tax=Agrobacterium rubi TaxID=28099 RepID=A0AAE7R550_9HYPH|nr:carboxymuconolactone decarboxylase family protein [Agrobacterium rubi]NTE86476.1 peroxidase [Agrobacterium rubi]NTF02408.1 peroxidase [Agrobacterium rubi]NTF36652.1 peroxidase [Agrobacterium rubi]OCJ55714.1 peroxidase [Agrobacterium rubi]QTF99106.1 peroxidase [Agrobacterium rubi]
MFIAPPEPKTSRKIAEMYDSAEQAHGYLPNMYRAFGHRPEVMESWSALLVSLRGNIEPRRYELVTLAAARELRSSYCMLAHGAVLAREGVSNDELEAIVNIEDDAPLNEQERAIMIFATKVVRDATSVTQADIDALKTHALTDAEIFDIVAAAAARCFFSKTLDALGTSPDQAYVDKLGPELSEKLAMGRPIEQET